LAGSGVTAVDGVAAAVEVAGGVASACARVRREAGTAPDAPRTALGEAVVDGAEEPLGDGEALGVGDGDVCGFCNVETQDGRAVPDAAVALPMKKSPIDTAWVTSCWCPVRMSCAAWHCHSTLFGAPVCASGEPVTTEPRMNRSSSFV